jgi:hypothetical protein
MPVFRFPIAALRDATTDAKAWLAEGVTAWRTRLGLGSAALQDSSAFAAASHTQAVATITGLQSALEGKAATSHTHVIADTSGLQSTLDGKAAVGHSHGGEIWSAPNATTAALTRKGVAGQTAPIDVVCNNADAKIWEVTPTSVIVRNPVDQTRTLTIDHSAAVSRITAQSSILLASASTVEVVNSLTSRLTLGPTGTGVGQGFSVGSSLARAVFPSAGLTSADLYFTSTNGFDGAGRVDANDVLWRTGHGASSSTRAAGAGGDLIVDVGRGGDGTSGQTSGRNGRVVIRRTSDAGSPTGVLTPVFECAAEALFTNAPTTPLAPTGGAILYAEGGVLTGRNASGAAFAITPGVLWSSTTATITNGGVIDIDHESANIARLVQCTTMLTGPLLLPQMSGNTGGGVTVIASSELAQSLGYPAWKALNRNAAGYESWYSNNTTSGFWQVILPTAIVLNTIDISVGQQVGSGPRVFTISVRVGGSWVVVYNQSAQTPATKTWTVNETLRTAFVTQVADGIRVDIASNNGETHCTLSEVQAYLIVPTQIAIVDGVSNTSAGVVVQHISSTRTRITSRMPSTLAITTTIGVI